MECSAIRHRRAFSSLLKLQCPQCPEETLQVRPSCCAQASQANTVYEKSQRAEGSKRERRRDEEWEEMEEYEKASQASMRIAYIVKVYTVTLAVKTNGPHTHLSIKICIVSGAHIYNRPCLIKCAQLLDLGQLQRRPAVDWRVCHAICFIFCFQQYLKQISGQRVYHCQYFLCNVIS